MKSQTFTNSTLKEYIFAYTYSSALFFHFRDSKTNVTILPMPVPDQCTRNQSHVLTQPHNLDTTPLKSPSKIFLPSSCRAANGCPWKESRKIYPVVTSRTPIHLFYQVFYSSATTYKSTARVETTSLYWRQKLDTPPSRFFFLLSTISSNRTRKALLESLYLKAARWRFKTSVPNLCSFSEEEEEEQRNRVVG